MKKNVKKGIFPTMVTPFTDDDKIDFNVLEKFIEKLENDGSDGLFAVCQSSEMFYLSLQEKIELASFVKEKAHVDVIASGHTQSNLNDQVEAMKAIEQTGVDAVVLLSNAFAGKDDNDEILIKNMDNFLSAFKSDIPLGIYECPYPYKRILSPKVLDYILNTDRFILMKDTSCDAVIIGERIELIGEKNFNLYNANAQTLAFSTINGGAGFSGTIANVSPKLVQYIMENPIPMNNFQAEVHGLFYEFSKFFGNSPYPVTAKIMLEKAGIFKNVNTRVINPSEVDRKIYHESHDFLDRIMEFEKYYDS